MDADVSQKTTKRAIAMNELMPKRFRMHGALMTEPPHSSSSKDNVKDVSECFVSEDEESPPSFSCGADDGEAQCTSPTELQLAPLYICKACSTPLYSIPSLVHHFDSVSHRANVPAVSSTQPLKPGMTIAVITPPTRELKSSGCLQENLVPRAIIFRPVNKTGHAPSDPIQPLSQTSSAISLKNGIPLISSSHFPATETPLLDDIPSFESPKFFGRRVFGCTEFLRFVHVAQLHSRKCTKSLLDFQSEVRYGLSSCVKFKCRSCEDIVLFCTNTKYCERTVNAAVTLGCITIGIGASQLTQFLSIAGIPSISTKHFAKEQDLLTDAHCSCAEVTRAMELKNIEQN